MKRTVIFAVVAAFLLLGGATLSELSAKEWQRAPSAGGVPIDAQHFPDEQFRAYIRSNLYDKNRDGLLSDEERNSVTSMTAHNSLAYTFPEKIKDLRGVEFFPNLKVLYCEDNLLTELNLTDNHNLTSLTCSKNQLTQLDLTGNPELWSLTCNKNQLTSISISNNNSKLKLVSCVGNQLKVSAMETFISNLPERPDNDGMLYFWTDEVEDGNVMLIEQVAALNDKGWRVIKWVNGALGDYKGVVTIDAQHFPDDYFRAHVRGSYDQNQDGYLSDEERNNVTSLSVSENHEKIENMQGVEFFPNLEVLDCSNNKLSQLHLTGNPKLEVLTCSNNLLTQLDLKEIPNLKTLSCENNLLTSIDNSNNHQLMNVFCRGNQLKVPAMWTFITNLPRRPNNDGYLLFYTDEGEDGNVMSPEQVATLSNKGWTVYQWVNSAFSHYEGKKSNIYLNANFFPDAALRSHIASINHLTEGDELTDEIINRIVALNLKNSGVTDITGYQYLTNLHQFVTYGIVLSRLDVSMLPELELLDCTSNRGLNVLDLSNNKKLRHLKCSGNRLQSLDVSMLPNLQTLYCDQNYLSSLKMGSHPDLRQVQCQGNFLNAIQMGKVVDALPQLPNNMPGKLMVMDSSIEPSRTNTIYTSQVAEAEEKGWQVVYQNNQIYEGSDPVIGSGDADMSTTLDEWDLQIVSDYILGYVPDQYPGFDQIAADVNGDGRITIADVTIIIDNLKSPTSED